MVAAYGDGGFTRLDANTFNVAEDVLVEVDPIWSSSIVQSNEKDREIYSVLKYRRVQSSCPKLSRQTRP